MSLLVAFYAFLTALCTSLLMVPYLRRWALDRHELDWPDERKVHDAPTPRLGGIAIFLSFLFVILIFGPQIPVFRGLLAGSLVVFATGVADDLNGISPRGKSIGIVIACLVTIAVDNLWIHNLGNLFGFGQIVLPLWLGVPFTVFAVVGVSNALNLIDGLDGLAGGVALLALTAFALLGWLDGNQAALLLTVGLAGALLGFLNYNLYPARIFMGDAGSLTVGFVLGFLAVMLTQSPGTTNSPMLPVLVLALPIIDTIWVMARRIFAGQNPFVPDLSHVHHKFLDLGFEHRMTVVIIHALSLFWACSALVLRDLPEYQLLLYLLGTIVAFYILLRYLQFQRDKFGFLLRDSSGGLRSTVLFQHATVVVDRLMPLLCGLLFLYALLAVVSVWDKGTAFWPETLLLLIVGVGMRRWVSATNGFQLLVVYAVASLAAFTVWPQREALLLGLSPKRFGDALLLGAAFLSILKLLIHREGEFSIGRADYLVMLLVTLLAIGTYQTHMISGAIAGPMLRAIVLIVAIRAYATSGFAAQRLQSNAAMVLLVIFTVIGLLKPLL